MKDNYRTISVNKLPKSIIISSCKILFWYILNEKALTKIDFLIFSGRFTSFNTINQSLIQRRPALANPVDDISNSIFLLYSNKYKSPRVINRKPRRKRLAFSSIWPDSISTV